MVTPWVSCIQFFVNFESFFVCSSLMILQCHGIFQHFRTPCGCRGLMRPTYCTFWHYLDFCVFIYPCLPYHLLHSGFSNLLPFPLAYIFLSYLPVHVFTFENRLTPFPGSCRNVRLNLVLGCFCLFYIVLFLCFTVFSGYRFNFVLVYVYYIVCFFSPDFDFDFLSTSQEIGWEELP